MFKRKSLFVTFEGIEGSGKSYQSKLLYKNLKKKGIPVILTREPGGTIGAERIRKVILEDYFKTSSKKQFDKLTDTLLYLASRNEHLKDKIVPAISKKKIIICDRFVDSTIAYQVYGKGVNRELINSVHKHILGKLEPDITFVLKVDISKAIERLKKRKKKNRYDKFSKNFYIRVQKSFLKIAKKNKKRYYILDNSEDSKKVENIILNNFLQVLNK